MKQIKLFIWATSLLIAFDALWLGVFARNFYKNQIGVLYRAQFNWPAALFVWGLIAAGILFFVVPRAYLVSSFYAFFYGALFGLILYGVYDFTNYAVLHDWPLAVSIVDIAWGTFLCGIVSAIICELARIIK